MRTGVFVGSFDPFTVGHASVLRRVMPLFDRIVVGVGVNIGKRYMLTAEERVDAVKMRYGEGTTGSCVIEVKQYSGLTVDFARAEGAQYIIKGVRSVKDYEYEREQADINRMLGGIETILLFAEPRYAGISSSLVRELMAHGRDTSCLTGMENDDADRPDTSVSAGIVPPPADTGDKTADNDNL